MHVDAAPERLADFAAALRPRLAGELRTDGLHRALYATDASLYRVPPLGVLVPRSVDDVRAALEEAARFGVPVLPRGSGTSLAGSAVGAALVVDTTRHLDRIVALDPEARTATVEPGVVLDTLNRAAARHGLRFGPDPASSSRATLGGMVGTNATGARSIRYGSVVDHVIRARAFLPGGTPLTFEPLDGAGWDLRREKGGVEGDLYRRLDAVLTVHGAAIARDTPRHWRRAGGYRLERLVDAPGLDRGPGRAWDGTRNVAHLLCGAEGTLVFTTEITVGLVEKPTHGAIGVAHYASRRAALEAVQAVLDTGPSAVELFDRIALRRARDVTEYAPRLHFLRGDPAALLIVEYEGASAAEVADGLARLRRALGPDAILTDVLEEKGMADVRAVRAVGLGLAMSARLPVQAVALIEDAAVPVAHLPDYVERLEALTATAGVELVVYAHASAGCLHVRPFLDTKQARDVGLLREIAEGSAALVREYGGTLASEHGDGLARSSLAPSFYGAPLYAAYVATKRAFDPQNLLNPGKVVEAPPLDRHLRLSPTEGPRPHAAPLAFRTADGRDLGLAGAVEACNGQAVCRQRSTGAMCPSFMATREEKDSTRGRADALREALAGHLSLTGPEVAEAMDLCLACKACVSECPSSVDVAAMKAVWLHERWQTERPPLRTRVLAHLPTLARRGAGRTAPFLNRLARLGPAVLGLDPTRSLPTLARRPFRDEAWPAPADPDVVVFADTFARFFEPEVAHAARRVMEAAGVRAAVAPYACCGRTLLSEGFLDAARAKARRAVDVLAPHAEAGRPIVGLEPSCLLTLRDEVPRLLPDHPRAALVARHARTFDEWTASSGLELPGAGGPEALVHTHCHQRALVGAGAAVAALAAGGVAARESGAGCCGLAGGWGYEAGHAEVSRAVAEERLAPAVRALPPEAEVIAAGFSCRSQIAHVTGRTALHPAVALAARLTG